MGPDGEGNGASYAGFGSFNTFNADGQYVGFFSHASNLVAGDTNGLGDYFILDRSTGSLERVPAEIANIAEGFRFSISGDGRFLAFPSYSSNLVPGDTNGTQDIFIFDNDTGSTVRITDGNGVSLNPVLSADGRYVALGSEANNLVTGDTNGVPDVFIFDRDTGTIDRMLALGGLEPNNGSVVMSISPDAHYVGFYSAASN